jgi:hypothetical protein
MQRKLVFTCLLALALALIAAPRVSWSADTVVYFTPQDNDQNCTVLFLYNTGDVDATVPLRGFSATGVLVYSLNISVPAHHLVRCCSDIVITTNAPSWANTVVTNFTDVTIYAQLSLPAGVKVDGYVAWNPTGSYDPSVGVNTLKLQFIREQSRTNTVYFTPQDIVQNCTVLFLYNTSDVDAMVPLESFTTNGSLFLTTTISVPAHNLVRLCSDPVDSTNAPSWSNTINVNFTDGTAYAKLSLPVGVKVDGYVAWNPTGVYDPSVALPCLPLGFSYDYPVSANQGAMFLLLNGQ